MRELIAKCVKAGVSVRWKDGQPRLVGDISKDLLEEIRADRDGFLAAWRDYERHRYLVCPPASLPMRAQAPSWRREVERRVEMYVSGQGNEVLGWMLDRAAAYQAQGWKQADATRAALADVLYWQLERFPSAESLLMDLDEAVAHCQFRERREHARA